MIGETFPSRSPEQRRATAHDHLIDIDGDNEPQGQPSSSPNTPRVSPRDKRRHTIAIPAEGDVCFPLEGASELGEGEYPEETQTSGYTATRRRRRRWPDLDVLEEWSHEEKEVRSEGIRTKKISEPVLVGGRLRPLKRDWQRDEEVTQYRFTYFNEELPSTIHSQTISELLQEGQTFKDLFIPEPPELGHAHTTARATTKALRAAADVLAERALTNRD